VKRAQTSDKDDLCCNLIGLEPHFKHKVDDAAVTVDKKHSNDIQGPEEEDKRQLQSTPTTNQSFDKLLLLLVEPRLLLLLLFWFLLLIFFCQ
jgi:hypothetical protein